MSNGSDQRDCICGATDQSLPRGVQQESVIIRLMGISRSTAIHEAAHAVAAIRAGLVFDHVTAVADPEEEIDGALHWTELQNSGDVAMSDEASAMVLLAGPCAEARDRRLRFDRVFAGVAATDDREAVASLGLSDEQFITASRDALALIERDWVLIEHIADELELGRVLDFEEVEAIVQP